MEHAMRIICTKDDTVYNPYVPLPIGNGDLSLQIDYEGAQRQEKFCDMTPGIRRAGYRYDSAVQPAPRGFIPLGFFDQVIAGAGEPPERLRSRRKLQLPRSAVGRRTLADQHGTRAHQHQRLFQQRD